MKKDKKRFQRHNYRDVETKKRFLIVTEGTETEPRYFKAFRTYRTLDIKTIGTGRNTIQVVQKAIDLKKHSIKDEYDEIWSVFDRDSFPKDDYMKAIDLAHKNDIKVAVSNECFELWFLLHFNLITTSMSRNSYLNKLDNTYDLLKPYQGTAMKYAEKLYDKQNKNSESYYWNPYTSVFELVKKLNKNIRE